MDKFTIYDAIKVEFVKDMIPTIETNLPNFMNCWEYLSFFVEKKRWRQDLDRDLELIGTGFYTVLKSLNYVRISKDKVRMNDRHQRFKNIYIHFGLIIDCIRQISRSILVFSNKLRLIDFQEKSLSLESVHSTVEGWYKNRYDEQYKNLINQGVPVSLKVQPNGEYLYQLAVDGDLKKYKSFVNSIPSYRNILIHSPAIDIFTIKETNQVFAIRKNKMKKHRTLNDLQSSDPDDRINPNIMTNDDYNTCLEVIEEVWSIYQPTLAEIVIHQDFKKKSRR